MNAAGTGTAPRYCSLPIGSRSRFAVEKRCYDFPDHPGRCSDMPFLRHLLSVAPKVAKKIVRDSTMTTGAAWLSDDAGFNRVQRWAMLLPDDEIERITGKDMSACSEGVQRKLREKAATYEDCISVAQYLAWLVYSMSEAPAAPPEVEALADLFGPIQSGSTTCIICKAPISFDLFAEARRGKAAIETAHKNPRVHTPENVGFAHRFCNIAQGDLALDDFYDWMEGVLARVGR